MAKVITIPKELAKEKEVVLIPRKEYEKLLRLKKEKEWELRDTDEAIRVFKKEKKEGKLQKLSSLKDIE